MHSSHTSIQTDKAGNVTALHLLPFFFPRWIAEKRPSQRYCSSLHNRILGRNQIKNAIYFSSPPLWYWISQRYAQTHTYTHTNKQKKYTQQPKRTLCIYAHVHAALEINTRIYAHCRETQMLVKCRDKSTLRAQTIYTLNTQHMQQDALPCICDIMTNSRFDVSNHVKGRQSQLDLNNKRKHSEALLDLHADQSDMAGKVNPFKWPSN